MYFILLLAFKFTKFIIKYCLKWL